MSNIFVKGLRAPDDRFHKMKAVLEACYEAGVEPPGEVCQFFDWDKPDENGVKLDIWQVEEYKDPSLALGDQAYSISLKDLPSKLTHLLVYVIH